MSEDFWNAVEEEEKNSNRIFSNKELAEENMPFCVQGVKEKQGKFGPQWEASIVHAKGTQVLWFPMKKKDGSDSYYTRVFTKTTSYPVHACKLYSVSGFLIFQRAEETCPCQFTPEPEEEMPSEEEVQAIIANTMKASEEQKHRLVVMAASLKVKLPSLDNFTVSMYESAMAELAAKHAGMANGSKVK